MTPCQCHDNVGDRAKPSPFIFGMLVVALFGVLPFDTLCMVLGVVGIGLSKRPPWVFRYSGIPLG